MEQAAVLTGAKGLGICLLQYSRTQVLDGPCPRERGRGSVIILALPFT